MLLDLNDDQEFFRQTTERFLVEQMPPEALRSLRDDPAGFDPAYWRGGAQLGWTSLLVSEDHGGGSISEMGLVDLSLVAYEFGRHASPGPLVACSVVAGALSASGGASEVLSAVLSGEQIASWCGPQAEPDGWRPTVEMHRRGSDFALQGEVGLVESAMQADHLLVTCRGEAGITQILVPTSTAGVTRRNMQTVDLTRRFGLVTFDDVTVPPSALVGAVGEASAEVDRQLEVALVLLNAEAVGAMQAGFDMTAEWAFDRYAFGRALASYQALKHRFADMLTWLEASHAISDAACIAVAARKDNGAEMVSAAKAYIGEYGTEVLQDCVQLHGGMGVTFEHDLHLFLRRFTVDRALGGTPAVHRQRIAVMLSAKEGNAA
jgi:alkylation response protein AidB-like acyl-CoA dehydrogenase